MKNLLILFLILICPTTGKAEEKKLIITGSTTVQPIIEKIIEAYITDINSKAKFKIIGNGSGNGIKELIDGTTDISISSRFIKTKELEYAQAKKVYPVPFQIAYDCIIPIIHPYNTVETLTLDQIHNIFAGLITNWKELKGGDLPITVISRNRSSGTYDIWEEKVMTEQAVMPAAKLEGSNQDVVKTVSIDISAIGYIGLGYLDDSIKAININFVKPVCNNQHPLRRPLFMFTRGWPTGETLKFVHYVLNPEYGQKWVIKSGYVSLYQQESLPIVKGIENIIQ